MLCLTIHTPRRCLGDISHSAIASLRQAARLARAASLGIQPSRSIRPSHALYPQTPAATSFILLCPNSHFNISAPSASHLSHRSRVQQQQPPESTHTSSLRHSTCRSEAIGGLDGLHSDLRVRRLAPWDEGRVMNEELSCWRTSFVRGDCYRLAQKLEKFDPRDRRLLSSRVQLADETR